MHIAKLQFFGTMRASFPTQINLTFAINHILVVNVTSPHPTKRQFRTAVFAPLFAKSGWGLGQRPTNKTNKTTKTNKDNTTKKPMEASTYVSIGFLGNLPSLIISDDKNKTV